MLDSPLFWNRAVLAALCAGVLALTATPAPTAVHATSLPTGTFGCGIAHTAGDTLTQLVVAGTTRRYRIHVPAGYSGHQALPLLFSFHGAVSLFSDPTWVQEYMTNQNADADTHDYLVVYPVGLGNTWNVTGPSDVPFVNAVWQQVQAQYCVDPSHVSAVGLSMGGIFAWYLATQVSWLAAVMPVAATEPGWYATFHPPHPTSLLLIVGTHDPKVPYNGSPTLYGYPVPVPSIPADVRAWATSQGSPSTPTTGVLAPRIQGDLPVSTTVYSNPVRPGVSVQLYAVVGGGHQWFGPHYVDPTYPPGSQTIDATALVGQFLRTQSFVGA